MVQNTILWVLLKCMDLIEINGFDINQITMWQHGNICIIQLMKYLISIDNLLGCKPKHMIIHNITSKAVLKETNIIFNKKNIHYRSKLWGQ